MVSADDPPKNVVLFSGHMIDAPDRKAPRFPPSREPIAAAAIAATLEDIGAGRGDLGMCGGACGGDLLFAEACLAKGMRLEIYLPLDEPEFLAKSVVTGFVTGLAMPTKSPDIWASIAWYLIPASPPITTSGECPRYA